MLEIILLLFIIWKWGDEFNELGNWLMTPFRFISKFIKFIITAPFKFIKFVIKVCKQKHSEAIPMKGE